MLPFNVLLIVLFVSVPFINSQSINDAEQLDEIEGSAVQPPNIQGAGGRDTPYSDDEDLRSGADIIEGSGAPPVIVNPVTPGPPRPKPRASSRAPPPPPPPPGRAGDLPAAPTEKPVDRPQAGDHEGHEGPDDDGHDHDSGKNKPNSISLIIICAVIAAIVLLAVVVVLCLVCRRKTRQERPNRGSYHQPPHKPSHL